ncbi:hypothetical protein [Gemmata sp.]|uniref:hypothetical protein n=1 Tax=Gemmata sp. TaxID=1914242 RepID=UPI003F71B6D6
MDQPRELSPLELANKRREREAVRAVGWAALGIGLFFWSVGWFCVVVLPSLFGMRNLGGATGDPVLAASFGLAALVGCALAVSSRHYEGEPLFHARLAAGLNGLLVIVAFSFALKWL